MIHYHGTPVGGTREDVVKFLAGRHALVSFAYPCDLPAVAEVCQSFCIDNGAFTAWKQGKVVDRKEYAFFVEKWYQHPGFDWCLIPDIIDGSWSDNRKLIEAWETTMPTYLFAKRSVPVWHLHDPLEALQELCGRFDRVALGSSGQWATPGTDAWWNRMAEAMAAACEDGKPRAKLHGLRMLNPEIFSRLPLASADSTNASQNNGATSRFGMYPPPTAGQRAAVIADRIESQQSAAVWSETNRQDELFQLHSYA